MEAGSTVVPSDENGVTAAIAPSIAPTNVLTVAPTGEDTAAVASEVVAGKENVAPAHIVKKNRRINYQAL